MDLGPHAATIWICYAIVVAILGGLAIWLIADGRRLKAEIARLEAKGVRRRSAGDKTAPKTGGPQPEPNTRA